eukprot:1793220-Pleurochrysis_carterae.AAC.1
MDQSATDVDSPTIGSTRRSDTSAHSGQASETGVATSGIACLSTVLAKFTSVSLMGAETAPS